MAQVAHPLLERVSALMRAVQGWSVPVRGMLCCSARRTSSECPTSRRFCFQLPMRSVTCPVQTLQFDVASEFFAGELKSEQKGFMN